MSLHDLPRGYDRYVTRGPSERDIEAETERRNAEYDEARDEARDEAMHDRDREDAETRKRS
jgi:hypothetical protein